MCQPSMVDGCVALAADHQGLPPPGRHRLHPERTISLASGVEVRELADVVHLDLLGAATEFAFVGEQSLEQLVAAGEVEAPQRVVVGLLPARQPEAGQSGLQLRDTRPTKADEGYSSLLKERSAILGASTAAM